jgi:hypothetical protein
VGCPGWQAEGSLGSHNGFTSATLNRLSNWKPSAMASRLTRSFRQNLREIRKSTWKNPGSANVCRPRFPVQPAGG